MLTYFCSVAVATAAMGSVFTPRMVSNWVESETWKRNHLARRAEVLELGRRNRERADVLEARWAALEPRVKAFREALDSKIRREAEVKKARGVGK